MKQITGSAGNEYNMSSLFNRAELAPRPVCVGLEPGSSKHIGRYREVASDTSGQKVFSGTCTKCGCYLGEVYRHQIPLFRKITSRS